MNEIVKNDVYFAKKRRKLGASWVKNEKKQYFGPKEETARADRGQKKVKEGKRR